MCWCVQHLERGRQFLVCNLKKKQKKTYQKPNTKSLDKTGRIIRSSFYHMQAPKLGLQTMRTDLKDKRAF